jgi:hypothetical protein
MERESLRDKLDQLDLSQIDGLQWDQERAWTRLNGQLQSTSPRKTKFWHYGIAASLVLMIISLSGYVLLITSGNSQGSSINRKQLTSGNMDLPTEACAEVCEPQAVNNNADKSFKKVSQTVPVLASASKDGPHQMPTVIDPPVGMETKKDAYDMEMDQQINEPVTKVITPLNASRTTTPLVAQQAAPEASVLSSTPLGAKKRRFGIKLFQRKHSRSSSKKIRPALTLFASK